MNLQNMLIDYEDTMREVTEKINAVLTQIIGAVGEYPSLKEYIEELTGGIKGTIEATPEGVQVVHNFNTSNYQVIVTADENVNTWSTKQLNYVTIYASEISDVDYAILSTTDALRLVRDNLETVQEVVEARSGYPNLKAYLDYLDNKTPESVSVKRAVFSAFEGQTVFTLPEGESYVQGTNTITVYVSGVKQRSNYDFRELSPTKIRFNTPLRNNWSVEIIWFDITPTSIVSHNSQHSLGGGDEITLDGSQIIDETIPDSALEEKYVKHILSENVPSTGRWVQGDLVFKSNPSPGNFIGWVCVQSGEYGTWSEPPEFKGFGLITE